MANTFLPLSLGNAAAPVAEDSRARISERAHLTLSAIDLGTPAYVVALTLEDEMCAWLGAVGIREGERLVVLRRAAFGGPIHVRTHTGGEFALNRQLAKSIHLRLVKAGDAGDANDAGDESHAPPESGSAA